MRIQLKTLLVLASPLLLAVAVAYIQWGTVGLSPVLSRASADPDALSQPHGFPAWLRITHYVNLLFMVLIIRSGVQILVDHPRLYWNVHCTPGSEWLRLTPREVPKDREWTSKQDALHLSPWIGLPGFRHTVGMARHWHFLSALFWIGNGLIYVTLLFATGHWQRLVPTSWQIVPDAWTVFTHYATFHIPTEPDGFYRYNPLQQLSYFGVIFVLAPMAMLTGPSMSPAFTNRFPWYPKLPGNRQIGRSIHFLILCAFLAFIFAHVTMVVVTGFAQNMNHIVVGTDDVNPIGLYLGLVGIGVILFLNVLANWAAWRRPRAVQHIAKAIVQPIMQRLLDRPTPVVEFRREDISPYFWVNGTMPTSDEWKSLAADDFRGYRLKVYGLVENPVELSLDDLKALGEKTHITLHHCIQGWSGIAAWTGLPIEKLIERVRPTKDAGAIIFYSFGDGFDVETGKAGGQYYDSLSIENAMKPQTLLAYGMNDRPLTQLHGAPLRLRVENQLGFKMVKWIQAIEFVADVKTIYKGEGGYAGDNEYFGELANI